MVKLYGHNYNVQNASTNVKKNNKFAPIELIRQNQLLIRMALGNNNSTNHLITDYSSGRRPARANIEWGHNKAQTIINNNDRPEQTLYYLILPDISL